MSKKILKVLCVSTCAAVLMILGQSIAQAQTWTAPRTSFGHPDLQGVWDFATITPLERPEEFSEQALMTEEESASYEQARFDLVNHDTDEGATLVCEGTGNYNEFWYDRGFGDEVRDRRTSLIIDPPNGRIPTLTTEAEYRIGLRERRSFESWESRGIAERCMAGFNTGPPMFPSAYNNYVQFIQTADYVVVFNEMIHDARIVPFSSQGGVENPVPQWLGNSHAHWDGDSLIIETKNFSGQTAFTENQGATTNISVVERFTRTSENIIEYEFTVEDSSTWTRPWTVMVPMTRSDTPIYEYACHEGNYGMTNILSGARTQEGTAQR